MDRSLYDRTSALASSMANTLGRWVRLAGQVLLAAGALLALPILLDAAWWAVLLVIALGMLLALPVAAVTTRFTRRPFGSAWRKSSLVLAPLLAILLASPVHYLAVSNALRPPALPQVVLTDGSKTITFQGMIHIGSESFYKAVFYDLESALADGAVIYYEGVKPDPEGDAWLHRMISGGKGLDEVYTGLGHACGLVFQNEVLQVLAQDIQARPDRHVTADVSTLDMKREFDRLMASDPAFAAAMKPRLGDGGASKTPLDSDLPRQFVEWQKRGTEGQKALAGTICRGAMATVQRRSTSRHESDDPLDRVLLDFRNRQLVDRIAAEPRQKIFLTYGAGHLPGLFELLKARNPAWHVVTVKWLRTLDPPQRADGSLDLGS